MRINKFCMKKIESGTFLCVCPILYQVISVIFIIMYNNILLFFFICHQNWCPSGVHDEKQRRARDFYAKNMVILNDRRSSCCVLNEVYVCVCIQKIITTLSYVRENPNNTVCLVWRLYRLKKFGWINSNFWIVMALGESS